MKCPKCNSEVKKGAFFCTQCGIRLFDDKGKYLFEKTTEADKNIDVDSMNALNDGNKNNINIKIEEHINDITQPLSNITKEPLKNKKSKKIYVKIGIIALLIVAVGVLFIGFRDNFSKIIDGNIPLQNIQVTKYFVKPDNESNIYYSVELKILWPNTLGGNIQKEIVSKAFGINGNNIDDAMSEYFRLYGEEISELPEIGEATYDQRYITINIDSVAYIKDKYIAFSINYEETSYGGSINAADIWSKYVNYDIKNSKVLSLSDILSNNVSDKDVLNELKRSLSIDIDRSDILSDEVLLTGNGARFFLKTTSNELKAVELNLSNEYISPNVKELFQIKEEYNETETDGIKFLKNIYENYIFGNQSFSSIAPNICSERILQRLKDEFYYDCENGDCYALWLFRTSYQDGTNDITVVNNIIARDNNWFDVYYSDMGFNGKTSFKLTKIDNEIKIDEIFIDKSYIVNYDGQENINSNYDGQENISSNYDEQENINSDGHINQEVKETINFFNEPAYLMDKEDVQNELIGAYYWQCASDNPQYINPNHNTLGLTISMNGLELLNEFVKEIYPPAPTSNINGTVPANAKYEKGHWYKQNNTKNNATMYYLVGHETNIEIMRFANKEWTGNDIIHNEASPNAFIIMMKDKSNNWYYVSKKGQYVFEKK